MYLNVFWLCGTSWKKLCQCNTVSSFQKKQRRVELKSVGNFVAKTVLVESANQFSLEELCRTQYSMKYFLKPYRPSYLWQNLKVVWRDCGLRYMLIRNIATNVTSTITRTCRLFSIVVTSSKYVGNFGHGCNLTWSFEQVFLRFTYSSKLSQLVN